MEVSLSHIICFVIMGLAFIAFSIFMYILNKKSQK